MFVGTLLKITQIENGIGTILLLYAIPAYVL